MIKFKISDYLFYLQDIPALFVVVATVCIASGFAAAFPRFAHRLGERLVAFKASTRIIGFAATLVTATCLAGAIVAFEGTPLSRDETFVDFDAATWLAGSPVARVAPEWRLLLPSLVPVFLQAPPDASYILSSYLPVNALLHVPFAAAGLPELAAALLAGVAAAATFFAARAYLPGAQIAPWAAALLLATSPQFLMTGMTRYAMTAHLALNMLWLLAACRPGALGWVAAAFISFLATGLHQPLFHPIFALPFVLHWAFAGERRKAAVLGLGVLISVLIWRSYFGAMQAWFGPGDAAAPAVAGAALMPGFWERAKGYFDVAGAERGHFVFGIFRFFVWQNPWMWLLAACVGRAALHSRQAALWAGAVAMAGIAALLMPYQGHGWGYRYLHGHLGALAILAGAGAERLANAASLRARVVFAMVLPVSLVSVAVLMPVLLVGATFWNAPYAAAVRQIAASQAGVVVVDHFGVPFGSDLVRNDPLLRTRPIVLDAYSVSGPAAAQLCGLGLELAVFRASDEVGTLPHGRAMLPRMPAADPDYWRGLGCKVREGG